MQRGIVIILAVLMFIISCSEDEPTPIPTPQGLDCNDIYPEYDSTINISIFNFEWCAKQGATQYYLQVSDEESFSEIMFDTVTSETTKRATVFLVDHGNGSMVEYFPFIWGTTYYWRVAPIIDGQQGEWSDIYTFKTWDERDKLIGTYTMDKHIYKISLSGYSYISTDLGEGQVKVEKVENSKNIRITEIGGNNLTEELSNSSTNGWTKYYDVYPHSLVTYPNDSIRVIFMTNPGDSIPWGYYYGGHY